MTDSELGDLVNEVLTETLGEAGFERADLRAGTDHDGDKALFITAHFRSRLASTASRPSLKALGKLRLTLLERDEERFPYVDFTFPGDEVLAGEAEPR